MSQKRAGCKGVRMVPFCQDQERLAAEAEASLTVTGLLGGGFTVASPLQRDPLAV